MIEVEVVVRGSKWREYVLWHLREAQRSLMVRINQGRFEGGIEEAKAAVGAYEALKKAEKAVTEHLAQLPLEETWIPSWERPA